MRTFGTIVLGFFFLLVFNGCFIVHSVGGYPLDAEAVTETMRKAGMYDIVLDGLDLALKESVAESDDPELAKEVGGGMKDAFEESMSEEWFYETFEKAYGGFVAYLEGSDEEHEVDLSEQKESLEKYLKKTAKKYGADKKTAKKDIKELLEFMPEKASMNELLEDSGGMDEKKLEELRGTISTFNTIRIVLLVITILLLGLIALVAKKTSKRLLISVGVVFLLSSVTYLGVAGVAGDALWDAISEDMDEPDDGDKGRQFAAEATTKLFKVGMNDAFGRSNLPVGGLAALGIAMIAAGFVFGRKKQPPTQGAGMPPQQPQPPFAQGQPPQQPYAPPQNPPQAQH